LHPNSFRYIRRSLIWIIILVVFVVLANYLYVRHIRIRNGTEELPLLSPEMKQSAEGWEYSDYENAKLQFKIVARRLVETQAGKVFLQGIEAFNFNPDETVHNEIRSLNAEYDLERNTVDFKGDVRLFLEQEFELRVESLHYDTKANIGTSRDLVRFYSERLTGEARGLRYDLNSKSLTLNSEISFLIKLEKDLSDGSGSIEEFHAVSDSAVCSEKINRIRFRGNARLESDSLLLTGDTIEAAVDPDRKEPSSLTSTGNAYYRSKAPGEDRTLSGDRMLLQIHPVSRNLESVYVTGHAVLDFITASEEQHLQGAEIDLHLDPEKNMPLGIEGQTGVLLRVESGMNQTLISGELFKALFYPENQGLKNIDVRQQARISMAGDTGSAGQDIRAKHISMKFRQDEGAVVLESLRAEDAARWTYHPASQNGAGRESSSATLDAEVIEMFYSGESGSLNRIETSGDVVMAETTAHLKDDAYMRKIFADRALFHFYPGGNRPEDMNAEGAVRVVYERVFPSDNPVSEGFHTSSDRLKALFLPDSDEIRLASASQWGNFKYEDATMSATSGSCDYDAQEERIILKDSPEISFEMGSVSGETVEFDRKQEMLSILGSVRSILSESKDADFFGPVSASSRSIILADAMQYHTESGNTQYSGNVQLLSEDHQLQADRLDILGGGARIEAEGNIRHYITGNRISDREKNDRKNRSNSESKESRNSSDVPINIESSRLDYEKDANTLVYSGNIILSCPDFTLTSGTLEALLDEEGKALRRATAKENVVVRKGNRECKGDVAYYYGDPERFEVFGTPAELFDPEGGRSFSPRLTSNVADDRILLEGNVN
jgi:LPS export ABC transporter protein LptC